MSHENHRAEDFADLTRDEVVLELISALNRLDAARSRELEAEGHWGPHGHNCINAGQFDAGECWLCYARRKREDVRRLKREVVHLEKRIGEKK